MSEEQSPIGVIVDEVHDIIAIEDSGIERRPVGGGRFESFTLLADDVVTVLDPRDIIQNAA